MIDGSKQFITNATTAGLFVVFARTAAATSTSPGIAVFLVPADAPGIGIGVKDAKIGQEGSRTADLSFAGVRAVHAGPTGSPTALSSTAGWYRVLTDDHQRDRAPSLLIAYAREPAWTT